jgi:signal transduction histidine kinase/HAMP domain-containing protein/DNA-binding response OmpR family regulator
MNKERFSSGNGSPSRSRTRSKRSPAPAEAPPAIPDGGAGVATAALTPLLDALRACELGDFGVRLPVQGSSAAVDDLARAFNGAVSRIEDLTRELIRVERVVGREGRMEERASLGDMEGDWRTAVVSVNALINDLVHPTIEVARVIDAVAQGDLTRKMALEIEGRPVKGEFLRIGNTVNTMVDQLAAFSSEVTRVAKEVGTDGKLGGQADVPGVSGVWKDLTDNVNQMASNLTTQVRGIVKVVTSVANGDLRQRLVLDAKGEIAALAETLNNMTNTLGIFAEQVTSVARTVGIEGRLGAQAVVPGVAGTWKELTDNVNSMASNLTDQVRNIAKVTTAVANGDLSQKITVDVKGEILELKNTINTMVDQLRSFASEVTRVAKEVGTDGRLGGQAQVPGVSGTWKDLTDNVNVLAGNLTDQVRNIAKVTTAVANGDLSQKITVDVKGEILELKNTINTMVDQLRSFASEVTRVAKEVGSEGKLGGQAEVPGVSGVWKDLTDNVNSMASNLTSQVRNIALVTTAVARGDLSRKITVDVRGELLELKDTVNTMVDQLNSFASEVTRVAREVGTDGLLGGQAEVQGVAGVWKNLTDNVNHMARNLTTQVRGIAKVVTAVANGDLRQKLEIDAKGEVAALAGTINGMTETLSTFAAQVSTVAREVGVEGQLGGQARVPGVAGTWKELTDNVNLMASNLTNQVRGIIKVVTAVANGDLTQKLIGVDAMGEVAALAETIDIMTDTLSTFANQVSSVAREVGIEGQLGGQAKVPGAAGTWRQLTDNVNQLADNLTTQVRAISEVATAVTEGDLTRSIAVDAQGEVASLKDTINQMIHNLRETTQKNQEQDWLKSNLARFSSMMQGLKSIESVSRLIMSELTPLVGAHHGAFFLMDAEEGGPVLVLTAGYAYQSRKTLSNRFQLGEGIIGQCAMEKKAILLTRVPPDHVTIVTGLGESVPLTLISLPVLFENEVKAVIELASFHPFSPIHQIFLDQLMVSLGVVINMITANVRTEQLLQQSQSLTMELQSQSRELKMQQQELKRSNTALERQKLLLEEKAALLEEQNRKVEVKNNEVELARASLEEKAEQLQLISKYKSEFLANMSHELRTPLNSLLILAKLLAENKDATLTDKQVEYAQNIYASGGDLLALINEILDLSRVESGKMQVEPRRLALTDIVASMERQFRPVADELALDYAILLEPSTPGWIQTDPQRLQQILKNLLSNAFKFTERGSVTLRMGVCQRRNHLDHESLRTADAVVSFAVEDTGIGIARDKQRLVFEAFQQADGSTARKYGGTGLGLSISREIAKLLGGEIHIDSAAAKGSTFTLYLPDRYREPSWRSRSDGPRRTVEESGPFEVIELPELHEVDAGPAELLEHRGNGAPLEVPRASVTRLLRASPEATGTEASSIRDDRDAITDGDRVLLVIEDDLKFAEILMGMARDGGFKVVVATRGDTGLALANELRPHAITLDIQLPVMDGFSVLDRLKRNPRTRHIPVHVISVLDREQRGACIKAFAYLEKPVTKEALEGALAHMSDFIQRSARFLLLVEDDGRQSTSMAELFADDEDVLISVAHTAREALEALETNEFDCLVLDLLLPDADGVSLLEEIKLQERFRDLPVIVYTNRDLSAQEEAHLKRYAGSIIMKSGAGSPDRLIDETSLFLHRLYDHLPEPTRKVISENELSRSSLSERTVLVVDDDIRNIFAIAAVLESQHMRVLVANNGRKALEVLAAHDDIEVVLMDVMMPEMDGYETMQAIRKDPKHRSLPIIAVTAKALKDDRDKCMGSGASDYLSKPINAQELIELLRLWTAP